MKFPKRAAPNGEGIGAANYLKIPENSSVTGVPRGEVFEFWQKWPKGGMKEVFTEPTANASSRFKINLVLKDEDGKFVAKVFEFGPRVYNQFADIAEELNLETTKIKISRRGSGKNTEWSVIPLGPIEGKALKAIEAVDLHSLTVPGQSPPQEKASGDDEELDF